MALPLYKTVNDQTFFQLQTIWKARLDPIIANPLLNGQLLSGIRLKQGTNVIDHHLGRLQLGWMLADTDVPYMPYRTQPFNSSTLTLVSSVSAKVSLWVF